MSYDDDWPDHTFENRVALIRKNIHPVSLAELKRLGELRFPVVTDPWCERYNAFLTEHSGDTYFMAHFFATDAPEPVELVYCRDAKQGMWFLPGMGMGRLQPKGIAALAEITARL